MDKTLLFLPGPVSVAEPVLAAMTRPLQNHRGAEFGELLGRVCQRLAPIFGTKGPVVLLGSSGTGGLEAAVTNMFSPGDVLLSCPVGVFGKRLAEIAQTFGAVVEILETPLGDALDAGALSARLRADTKREIAGVLLTHNETSTGVANDMAALAPILREHGAMSVVDSVSGLGASQFCMDEWGYDVVVSASQKALGAPPGIAMAALGPRALAQLDRARDARYYFDLKKAVSFAKKGQTPWTPPISLIYALDAALAIYERDGGPAIWARHETYARAVRAAFEAMGFTLFSRPGAHSVTVVAATPPQGTDVARLLKALHERGIVLSDGQGELAGRIVRMGTMGDISQTDVLYAIGAIENALLEGDIEVRAGSGVQAAREVFLGEGAGVTA